MQFFARFSPFRAIQRPARCSWPQRQRHELVFLFLSIVITTLLIAGFVKDSHVETAVQARHPVFRELAAPTAATREIRARQIPTWR